MVYEIMNREHLLEISEMYVQAFNAPPWNDKWTAESVTARLLQMMNCDGFYGLVCLNDNSICGMILGNKEIFYDCIHFNIKEFCVRLDLRSTGIGTELLSEFENRLLMQGIDEIYLFTSRTDSTEAFYKKRGYESCDSLVIMNKPLHK